jgi:hypothetical protein
MKTEIKTIECRMTKFGRPTLIVNNEVCIPFTQRVLAESAMAGLKSGDSTIDDYFHDPYNPSDFPETGDKPMKPDTPGFWKSRSGRVVRMFVNERNTPSVSEYRGVELFYVNTDDLVNYDFGDEDWLPFSSPEFPESVTPDPPQRCLVRFWGKDDKFWVSWHELGGSLVGPLGVVDPARLAICAHKDNDIEVMNFISAADTSF